MSAGAALAEVYIYYRIASVDEAAVRQHVTVFQQTLRHRFGGLRTRLLRRVDGLGIHADDGLTMMEIYVPAPDAAGQVPAPQQLLAAIDSAAAVLTPLTRGERHVEVFSACA